VIEFVGNHIKKGLLLNLPVKKITIGEYSAKLQATSWLSPALCVHSQHIDKSKRIPQIS